MNRKYLKYYEKYSLWAPIHFLKDAFFCRERNRRTALLNRQKDYLWLGKHPDWLPLHLKLNEVLLCANDWGSYDYGEGYFYQGFKTAGLTGFRDTEARVETLGLLDLVRGKKVLDIGCNTGFLDIILAKEAAQIEGFDINPFLIDIANKTKDFLRVSNISFNKNAFEKYESEGQFDVVLSLANHSTYDGNTKQNHLNYFNKCASCLESNGILVFESHPLSYESAPALHKTKDVISSIFKIQKMGTTNYGTFFDRGRTFILAKKNEHSKELDN